METKNKPSIDEMLKMMAEELGETPVTMESLSKLNEHIVYEHAANKQFAMSGDHIPPKYKPRLRIRQLHDRFNLQIHSNFSNKFYLPKK